MWTAVSRVGSRNVRHSHCVVRTRAALGLAHQQYDGTSYFPLQSAESRMALAVVCRVAWPSRCEKASGPRRPGVVEATSEARGGQPSLGRGLRDARTRGPNPGSAVVPKSSPTERWRRWSVRMCDTWAHLHVALERLPAPEPRSRPQVANHNTPSASDLFTPSPTIGAHHPSCRPHALFPSLHTSSLLQA